MTNQVAHPVLFDDDELADDKVPPPAYGDIYGEIHDETNGSGTTARTTDDGRVNIRINHFNRRISQIFTPALQRQLEESQDSLPPPPYIHPSLGGAKDAHPPPPLNVVIQVVGSRGDVQPFVALGKVLKETYGHRVRLATHPTFRDFVQDQGLEFFSIGGDPAQLMAFMVKNPGLRPDMRSVASGDVGRRRKDVAEYIQGCWRSCYQPGDGIDDDLYESPSDETGPSPAARHFVADCIIANPPSFAHIHCAEKLGIPLHIMFTMPYSPTHAFPHPLANIQSSNEDAQLANYFSYAVIELLSWQVLGDIINRFRAKCLGLDPVSRVWGPAMLHRLKIPHTYCWSPALIPKPKDWGSHISISGFCFLNLASDYTPPAALQAFLDNGPSPVYIGFGSIVLDNPNAMTQLIFEAVSKTGQRVLLSKGWGGMGADELHVPNGIFMLGNVPHDWLFKHVSCVVHHGGAGTTAAGITAGRPTVVVPFFGDQPFWGAMVARAGAGPQPIPHKQLTVDKLADAINFCLKPESLERAQGLASKIAAEQGNNLAAQSIHQFLEPDRLRCTIAPARPSAWRIKRTKVRLSAFAAYTLVNANLLEYKDLKLFRSQEHYIDEGPLDPISGGFTAFMGSVGGMMMGLADVPSETWRAMRMPATRSRQQSQASLPTIASTSGAANTQEASIISTSHGQSETRSITKDSVASVAPVETTDAISGRSTPTSSADSSSVSGPSQGPLNPKQDDPGLSRLRSRNESSLRQNQDMLRPTGVHMTKGAGRFARAVAQGPVDISVNLTRGMHNIPKLWGDTTVRPQERVSDFRSGVKAVGREFGFGFYDGITGLVTQPWKGAQQRGASGFVKGVGKGIGGFIVKPGAAVLGILSHTMQGVNKEVAKLFGNSFQDYIATSRATQGYEEWLQSSDAEKQAVINGWKSIQKDLKEKVKSNEIMPDAQELQQTTNLEDDEEYGQNGMHAMRPVQSVDSAILSPGDQFVELGSTSPAIGGSHSSPRVAKTAIDVNVRQTMQEDVSELQSHGQDHQAGQVNVRQTTLASEAEAQRRASVGTWDSDVHHDDTNLESERNEFETMSERAAAVAGQSLRHERPPVYDPGHLAGTTQNEFVAEQKGNQGEKTAQEKTEEEIVMEYIKKQSLLEADHQNKGKGRATERDDEDDEELQRILKLSLQETGQYAGPSTT
jgi:UDP:flavonoid glycosyltransferase YjiC (YdhE family)